MRIELPTASWADTVQRADEDAHTLTMSAPARASPERSGRMPRFEVPDWVVRLVANVDADVRGNLGELGVVKRADASDVTTLLGRKLIAADDATIASARSLIEQGIA